MLRAACQAARRACPVALALAVMMTSMLTDDARVGDQVLRDGAVEYTIIWEPITERTTTFWRVRWEWDKGETDRTMPLGVDMPELVRPVPDGPAPEPEQLLTVDDNIPPGHARVGLPKQPTNP